MPMIDITPSLVLAFHDGQGGGSSPIVGIVFLAGIATAAWVIFSTLKWRNTMLVTAAGWVLVLGLAFVL